MPDTFKEGDRVRLKMALADRFVLPYRKWAHEGRGGTVLGVYQIEGRGGGVRVRVSFDMRKGSKREPELFPAYDLEQLPAPEPAPVPGP
jgi:hypothetical protein